MANSATVGSAVIKLSFDGKNVKADLNKIEGDIEKSGQGSGKKFGGTWAVAAGSLIASGIKKVGSLVTNTMGDAISRVDQLNNFPQVMTSLGYSAEEAESSISKINTQLDGLPTHLDDMTADVQKLAASMGNLAEGEVNATTVGLGLNDMFLAGGKGQEVASRAMEQYNQMLARGKVDMQSWNSLVDAAPGQMNQLAKSLLGAEANQADLYQAMQEGTVTFDQLNAAIVDLDQNGGNGIASFGQQAITATQGIGTQMENIQSSLTKVVAAALEGDEAGMDASVNQLVNRVVALAPTLIDGITKATNAILTMIPKILPKLIPVLVKTFNDLLNFITSKFPEIANLIIESIPVIMDGLVTMLQALVQAIPTIIPQLIQALTALVITISIQLTRPDFLSALLQGAITLFLELVKAIPQIIVALVQALPEIITNIVTFLTDPGNLAMIIDAAAQLFLGLVMAVPQILGALLGAFGTLVGNLWNGITSMFGNFAANFGDFIGGIFRNAINGVLEFIENFVNAPIDVINGFIDAINSNFGSIGVNIGNIDRIGLPRLAEGGLALSATTAIVGEAGKEAVLPLENNTDNWAGLLAATLVDEMEMESVGNREIVVNMTNQISNEMDAQDIGRVLMQSIRRAA